MDKSSVAVIGSGVSGLVAAWLLRNEYDVTLYEKASRFGGHTHTVIDDRTGVAVDTGFMVFNKPNYPLLTHLFEHLDIKTYPTNMSFAASINEGELEYSGSGLRGLFGQKRNLVKPAHWKMLAEIVRFNRQAHDYLASTHGNSESLGDFLSQAGYSPGFTHHYLLPMAAAIWSCPTSTMLAFPCRSFLQFFKNHGLIQLSDRPQWETVEGGSFAYAAALLKDLGSRAMQDEVLAVKPQVDGRIEVRSQHQLRRYDRVVMACHADEAAALLSGEAESQREALEGFSYQDNTVYLHQDPALMPVRRAVWSSWNYLADTRCNNTKVSVTYWMNSLQNIGTDTPYLVSLNPLTEPADGKILRELHYAHPVFDEAAARVQTQVAAIQGQSNIWFAGAWTGYGFHEDGMRSAVEVALALGVTLPWAEHVVQASRKLASAGLFQPQAATA